MGISRSLHYLLHSGKNSKLRYYIRAYAWLLLPRWLHRALHRRDMRRLARREDREYIYRRARYYNRLMEATTAGGILNLDGALFLSNSVSLGEQKLVHPRVYYLDSYRYAKGFPRQWRWVLLPGDVVHVPAVPSIVKSRPLGVDNRNSVLLKLDRVRHFLFVKDTKPFTQKRDMVIFRGMIGQQQSGDLKVNRYDFVRKFFGHPLCDVGVIDRQYPEWCTPKMTIREHLDFKFIMALEGNDVASNLKWIMSSNSVAVMPCPTCETWFMEGELKPNYHYIEIQPDFSDLEERLHYYIAHPGEAEAIISHAHDWVAQFRDRERERLISRLVLEGYFANVLKIAEAGKFA